MLRSVPGLLLLALLPASTVAQGERVDEVPITLEEAEALALEGNPTLRASDAELRAAADGVTVAGAFRWPGLQASAEIVGSDDPVAVFGSKLRQERFGAADLDVARLNDPVAVTDWTAGLGLRWEIGDPARWMALDAARARAEAARATADRVRQSVAFRAHLLWLDALRARERRAATIATRDAAEATRDRVARRRDEGMATEADRLLAEAALRGAEAEVAAADARAGDAADRLAVWLGWPAGRVPVPQGDFPEVAPPAAAPSATDRRADLVASFAALEARRHGVREASATRWPRLEGFAQVGTHTPGLGDPAGTHWTAGLRVSVPLFTGFGSVAATEAARAAFEAEEARHESRLREAESEIDRAVRALRAARRGLAAADAAADAAGEAVRLLRLRYDEGMATLAELLAAEAGAADTEAAAVDARSALAAAGATIAFVRGVTEIPTSEGRTP